MYAVGEMLRQGRHRRRLSRLDLATAADVSARHVSLVETGKSNPSADMILRLADQLDVPLRERNRLLVAAGYAPIFQNRPLDSADMAAAHLSELHKELVSYGPLGEAAPPEAADIALPIRIRHRGGELTFINTITMFGAAFDITLEEVAVEAYLPADPTTARALGKPAGAATRSWGHGQGSSASHLS